MCVYLVGIFAASFSVFLLLDNSSIVQATTATECLKVLSVESELRWSSKSREFSVVIDKSTKDKNTQVAHGEAKKEDENMSSLCVRIPPDHLAEVRFDLQIDDQFVKNVNCPSHSDKKCESPCMALKKGQGSDFVNPGVEKSRTRNNVYDIGLLFLKSGDESEINSTLEGERSSDTQFEKKPKQRPPFSSRGKDRRSRCKRCWRKNNQQQRYVKKLIKEFLRELSKKASRRSSLNYTLVKRWERHDPNFSSRVRSLQNINIGNQQSSSVYSILFKKEFAYSRFKRNPENSGFLETDQTICGLALGNASVAKSRIAAAVDSKNAESISRPWKPSGFPFAIRTKKSFVRLNFLKSQKFNEVILKHLVISIQFIEIPDNKKVIKPSMTEHSHPTKESSYSVETINNGAIIPAAIGGSLGLLFLTAIVVVLCRLKEKDLCLPISRTSRCHCTRIEEREKCLSGSNNHQNHAMTGGAAKQPYKKSEKSRENIGHSTVTMLEYKNYKRGRKQNRSKQSSSTQRESARKGGQNYQSSTCKHLLTTQGLSRHDHCIVCQMAGKPHQPIMDAEQYASELLPSVEGHTQGTDAAPNNDKINYRQPSKCGNVLSEERVSRYPVSVRLPDGEERYRGQPIRGSLMSGDQPFQVCVKAPPNRTIFSSDALPFASYNNNSPKIKSGYPGPPSSSSKSSPRRGYMAIFPNVQRSSRTSHNGSQCMCRCIMNNEPPPDYSHAINQNYNSGIPLSISSCSDPISRNKH